MRIAITMAEKILINKDCKEPDGVQLCKILKIGQNFEKNVENQAKF